MNEVANWQNKISAPCSFLTCVCNRGGRAKEEGKDDNMSRDKKLDTISTYESLAPDGPGDKMG